MKTFMRCFFALLFAHSYAQGGDNHIFEIRLADYNDAPVFESVDGVLRYAGTDTVEKAFFDGYTITNFYQTFPNSRVFRSLCVFTFETTSGNLMGDLQSSFPGKYFDPVELSDQKIELADYYPNDYGNGPYNPVPNLGAPLDLRSFDYVHAPKAWGYFVSGEIGNVPIGISDVRVFEQDTDFVGKTTLLGTFPYSTLNCGIDESTHGTSVAALAAARGNNHYGMTGVCPDCSIINILYRHVNNGLPDYDALLQLANAGAQVINMSWVQMHYNDPNFPNYTIPNPNEQPIIDELHEMGVILVAGAGNDGAYKSNTGPNHFVYGYPASYNHVISVSLVNSKNANLNDEVTSESFGHVSWYNQDLLAPTGLYESGVFTPYYEWAMTTNSQVDICGPGSFPRYANFLGCGDTSLGNATSGATPFVTGTAALMRSLNPCIIADEVEDVLQLTSKNIEANIYNAPYYGTLGAGKLETGDAVEFTHDMMSATGNALVDGQDFWRFDFDLRHIFNGLTISNQIFRDHNTTFFTAKNYIDVASDDDFKPGDDGFVDLNIDPALSVCDPAMKPAAKGGGHPESPKKVILHSVQLFPNPNTGIFDLAIDGYLTQKVSVTVYDVMGKEIYHTDSDNALIRVELANVPSGVYFVKLNSKTLNETIKFIKQ
jgi:subtilisin family serine protease